MSSELPDIPLNMRRLYRRFQRWRRARTSRFQIPERSWAAADAANVKECVRKPRQAMDLRGWILPSDLDMPTHP